MACGYRGEDTLRKSLNTKGNGAACCSITLDNCRKEAELIGYECPVHYVEKDYDGEGDMKMKRKYILLFIVLVLLSACGGQTEESGTADYRLLTVDEVQVEVMMVMVRPHISVTVIPTWPDECASWEKREGAVEQHQEGQTFYMDIYVTHLAGDECLAGSHPLFLGIGLDFTSLPAGEYVVNVNGVTAPFVITPEQAYDQNTLDQIEAVTNAVNDDLAECFGVTGADIISFQRITWMNSCLDLAEPDEVCADVLTPGYLVAAAEGEQVWEYHTNQDGSELRVVEP
jgi:hypothetical protein